MSVSSIVGLSVTGGLLPGLVCVGNEDGIGLLGLLEEEDNALLGCELLDGIVDAKVSGMNVSRDGCCELDGEEDRSVSEGRSDPNGC